MTTHAVARRPGRAFAGALCALALLAARTARAMDAVHLSTNVILKGRIVSEAGDHVILELERGSVKIPRADIVRIEKLPAATVEELERLRALAAESAEASPAETPAAEERVASPRGLSPKAEERIKRLVAELASEDPAARAEARAKLEREGKAAVAALTGALFSESYFARLAAAELLGKAGARESVRDMLVALRSAVPDSTRVRPWQRQFVKALSASLERITGRPVDIRERMADQDKVVSRLLEWWDGPGDSKETPPREAACVGWDTPQVGEPEVAADDPERARKLWEARRVGARVHPYRPPRAFVENVFGEEAPWAAEKE